MPLRVSYSLGSLLSVREILACAAHIGSLGRQPDAVWIPETWGMEAFGMISAVSYAAPKPRLGTSIINAYSRSPALAAMGAATADAVSGGRMVLGLGASSRPIVEGLHGQRYEAPLARVSEYIDVVRLALSGKKISHDGRFFRLRGFQLLAMPVQKRIPIYLAAVGPAMTQMCWEKADGAIFYLRPPSEMAQTIPAMQKKRKIDVACQIIAAVSDDADAAIARAKKTLAFYVAVAEPYRRFLAGSGYARQVEGILERHARSGLAGLEGAVPDSMAKDLTLCGTPGECAKGLQKYYDAGVDLPIIQFNPVGDAVSSFRLAAAEFSGGA